MLTETASFAELAWTALGFICTIINFSNLLDAMVEMQIVQATDSGGVRLRFARMMLRRERVLTILQAVFTLLGVFAVLTPQPERESVSILNVIASLAFILAEVALAADSLLSRQDRHWINVEAVEEFTLAPVLPVEHQAGTTVLAEFPIPRKPETDQGAAAAPTPPSPEGGP